jgi:hypothetical protein
VAYRHTLQWSLHSADHKVIRDTNHVPGMSEYPGTRKQANMETDIP